jgi:uncharacterized membrane protein HdeD (DUF308 family)
MTTFRGQKTDTAGGVGRLLLQFRQLQEKICMIFEGIFGIVLGIFQYL